MDIQKELRKMPEPDPEAIDRLRSKFRATRTERMPSKATWIAPALALAAAATLWVVLPGDAPRELTLNASGATETLTWSDQVQFEFSGHGTVSGTSQDVTVQWDGGRIAVQVAPNTGTELSIVTDEAIIQVIGTAFTVERDGTGVTIDVTHGRVAVDCVLADSEDAHVTNEIGTWTCLPLTAAGMETRADMLKETGASLQERLKIVNRGLEMAEIGTTQHGELLARRVEVLTASDMPAALADAENYLDAGYTTRKTEMQRSASRLALYQSCDRAMPHLEALQEVPSTDKLAMDAVLLAECLAPTEPERARTLLEQAVAELESDDLQRAQNALDGLGGK